MGEVRITDRPLTTSECADYMGFTSAWVRRAITDGVLVHDVIVRLEAESLLLNGRRSYRIHVDRFSAFLEAIGWKHLPRRETQAPTSVVTRPYAISR